MTYIGKWGNITYIVTAQNERNAEKFLLAWAQKQGIEAPNDFDVEIADTLENEIAIACGILSNCLVWQKMTNEERTHLQNAQTSIQVEQRKLFYINKYL